MSRSCTTLPRGLTIKAALSLSFGLTLSLWLFNGHQFVRGMADTERRSSGVACRYIQAHDLLVSLRVRVLATSGFVRDAVLDSNPRSAATNEYHVRQTLAAVLDGLNGYAPVLDSPIEHDSLVQLHPELDRFEATILDITQN